ncbi:MAG: hypothetical protein KDB27_12085 [Planctomycetales bacterium]|nr:hypothetical protein [Planctomycetales bacterium]
MAFRVRVIGTCLAAFLVCTAERGVVFSQTTGDGREQSTVRIERGDLAVVFRDNSTSPRNLSGVASLVNVKSAPGFDAFDPDTVGASAGLNFEHIISGHNSPNNKFTPRSGLYRLVHCDASSVKLVRAAEDSPWNVKSELTYRVVEPHYIDYEFRCWPMDASKFGERGYAILFFANYMNDVIDPAVHFRGRESADSPETWISADAPKGHRDWITGGNYRSISADDLKYDDDVEFRLNTWSYDWPRIAKSFYYGRAARDMTLILMFDRLYSERDQIRFSLYKFKLSKHPRPAWDFQYVINKVESGAQYGFRGRLVWKKFESRQDCQREYEKWAAKLGDGTAADRN